MPLDTIYLIHHSHTDIGFTHEQPVAIDLHARFIDQAIDQAEHTADYAVGDAFKWTCEVAYPVLHWLRTRPDHQIERFVKLAKAGRIEVAGMFAVMSQCMSHEAVYRQFDIANQFRRDLGLTIRTALQCDINGQHWSLVDALLDNGFDSFGMAINENVGRAAFQSQRPNGFYWEGPSGRSILTWNGLHYNSNSYFGIPDNIERAAQDLVTFQQWLDARHYPHAFSLFQVTCNTFVDNGPVNPKLPEFVRQWNAENRSPRLRIVTLSEFFDQLRKEPAATLPAHRGEWTDYWNIGASSTAYETALNRRTYHRLEEGELALALLKDGDKYRRNKDLADSWENAFLYDEHTWGANTSIVYPFAQAARSQLNHKLHYAYQARSLAQVVRLEAIDALARSIKTDKRGVLIFNPLPWDREERVEFPADWRDRKPWQPPSAAETISHVQYLDRNEGSEQAGFGSAPTLQTVPVKVPALGYRFVAFDELDAALATPPKGKASLTAENPWLKIALDPERGGIKRLFDKERNKEWVDRKYEYPFGGYVYESISAAKRKGVGYLGRMLIFRESNWSKFMAYGGWNKDWPAQRRGISKVVESRRMNLPGGVRLFQKCTAPGTNGVEYELTLLDNQPYADLRVTIDKTWDTAPEACYVAFPLALKNAQPRYQTAGGVVRPHIDQLPQSNQDYHTAQEWADFSDDECGLTITTIDAPTVFFGGFNISQLFDGPREKIPPVLLSLAMTNYYHCNYAGGQLGRIDFFYRLYPHGRFDASECNRIGRTAAHPLVCHPAHQPQGDRPLQESWLRINQPGISVLSVKTAQSKPGRLLHLFNSLDKPCNATLTFPTYPPREIWRADHQENPIEQVTPTNGKWTVSFPARSALWLRLGE